VARTEQKTVTENIRDLWELLLAYARQEMVDPLKGLGRYIGWGVGGSLFLGLGLVLLALGGLRALQTETGDVFDGNWSFAPYLIVFVVLVAVLVFTASRITREPKRRV
jgi:hypothetical protein